MGHKLPLFEVPIIPPDLRHEETIMQIANTLDQLAKVVDTIFGSINERIEQNQTRLNDLNHRIYVVGAKVEKLCGSNKATQIFSSAKYPAADVYKDYVSIFYNKVDLQFVPPEYKINARYPPIDGSLLEEKLQFYHVKSSHQVLHKNVEITPEEGLGNLPPNLESVSSLLLFNTSENPYKKYVTLDPMGVITKAKRIIDEEELKQMEAAPISISQKEHLNTQVRENYFYSPSLGDVPNIDVPLDLPDLPGIADDLRYSLDSGPGFAPSVASTPALPELPSIVPEEFTNKSSFPDLAEYKHEDTSQCTNISMNQNRGPAHEQQSVLMPPPPPPPPPPVIPALPEISEKHPSFIDVRSPAVMNVEVSSGDSRANLMEAIRKAGGSGKAKLRSVTVGKDEKKMQEEQKKLASGGDLMADLHNKLLMRRKGISGGPKQDVTPGGAMDKISAMIPPPPQDQTSASSATEDDDWD